jgi:uncharacterized Tic20 family protein
MKQNVNNTNAFLIHISAFASFLFSFGDIIVPLILWQTLKNRTAFLDEHGKEAVNFNISYNLYIIIATVIFIPFSLNNFFNFRFSNGWDNFNFHFDSDNLFSILSLGIVASIILILKFVLIIVAAIKAKDGENYKYPFTIKFIK